MPFAVRRAEPADRPDLEALCRAAVGKDDYVITYLDRILARDTGYVALEGARIVGLMTYEAQRDGSAWLGAARTHPDARRKGVATALTAALEERARADGRTATRLWSEAMNAPAQAAVRKAGYRELGRFARLSTLTSAEKGEPGATRAGFDDRLLEDVLRSRVLSLSDYYVALDFGFIALRRKVLEMLVEQGLVWRETRTVFTFLPSLDDPFGPYAHTAVLAGDVTAALLMARGLAASVGAENMGTFLPKDRQILEAAHAAGFELGEWGQDAVLFEKTLTEG